jgi:hypothetical protein
VPVDRAPECLWRLYEEKKKSIRGNLAGRTEKIMWPLPPVFSDKKRLNSCFQINKYPKLYLKTYHQA